MKVLYLSGMYPTPEYPQKGIFCHEQVKALRKLKIEVDVVVPIPIYDKEARQNIWELEGVRVQYLRFFKLPRAYDFHRTGISLFHALQHAVDLTKYDLIHADAALPSGYAAMLAAKKHHIPYIVHGHGLDVFLEESYQGYRNCPKIVYACQKAFENASAVIGVSQKVLDKVSSRVSLRNKGYVAYNGVDIDCFQPKSHVNQVTKFITVGNLIPLKGHDYTIRAIKTLVDCGYEKVHLDVVGRGYLEAELKKLVVDLKLEKYVTFHGYIPYDKVRDMMQESDVFVLPSWYEALGCVYLEAMACGLPVIGCYGNGIDEVYTNGAQGYLVRNKDGEQLVNAMKNLLDREQTAIMGKAARDLVVSQYTWGDSARAVLEVYKSCI